MNGGDAVVAAAILDSLWQAAAGAALLAAALRLGRRCSARARYGLACLALGGVVLAFGLNLAAPYWRSDGGGRGSAVLDFGAPPLTPELGGEATEAAANRRAAWILAWLPAVWACGVLLMALRLVWAAGCVRRIRLGAPRLDRRRFAHLAARLDVAIERIRFVETDRLGSPAAFGALAPVVAVPVGMLTQMPASAVEAILLHELAHVRRHDYLANLLQCVAEALLFYHPAVWWMSSVIRREREHCCDDLVLEATGGDAVTYAQALLTLEESRAGALLAPAATGGGGDLKGRIERMLAGAAGEGSRGGSFAAPLFLLLLLAGSAAAVFPVAGVAQQQQQQRQAPDGPYGKWLTEDVVYIITPEEREEFELLHGDEQRKAFIAEFWKRRDTDPSTEENEAREEHYRRIAYAGERFVHTDAETGKVTPGWRTDRGKLYIAGGPADVVEIHPSKQELWFYKLGPLAGYVFEFDGEGKFRERRKMTTALK